MSAARIERPALRHAAPASAHRAGWQTIFALAEAIVLAILVVVTLVVKAHSAPLPGDVRIELDLQHWLRPHRTLTDALDLASTVNWPLPAAIIVAASTLLLLALRRWLDALVLLPAVLIADGADYFISRWVHRARPDGHGIYVARVVKSSYSFPSDHVLHVTLTFGLLLFLSFQVRRSADRWLWPLRALLLVLILAMGPSRILEGEHWPSDVAAGLLYGCFWLLLATHVYGWAAVRWPRLLGHAVLRHPAA